MTTTEMSVVKKERFALLAPGQSEAKEAMQAMRETGMSIEPKDLLRIKVPAGGMTQWLIGEEAHREIVGALVFFQKCSLLWPSEDAKPGQIPVLRSFDGIEGEQQGPIPEDMMKVMAPYLIPDRTKYDASGNVVKRVYNIAEASGFPYSQWDTGKNGRGKRMKDQRILFILRPDDLMPLVVNVPPASIKAFDKFIKDSLQITKMPYWRYMVRLGLARAQNADGAPYAQIVPSVAEIIARDAAEALQDQWGRALREVAVKVADTAPQEE